MGLKRGTRLWIWLAAQAGCAAFFLADAVGDWFGLETESGFRHIHSFEMLVSLVLVVGVYATARQIRQGARREARMKAQLGAASGALAELIEQRFDEWNLSASERDVAMMAIKGLSVAEMAEVRNSREGTIKSQCAAVYRKADVSGRHQLLSLFIEDLLADPLIDARVSGAAG